MVISNLYINKNVYESKFNYFLIYFYFVLGDFINGFLLKRNSLVLFIRYSDLLFLCTILKTSIISLSSSLLDIAVVDFPNRVNRFELNYVFILYGVNIRLILKTFVSKYMPVFSISNIFSSAGWLEREV